MEKTEALLRLDQAFMLVLPIATWWVCFISGTTVHGEYGVNGNGFHFKLIKWPKHDELVFYHGDAVMVLPEGSPEGKYSAALLNVMEGGAEDEKYFDDEDKAWKFADQGIRRFFINRETSDVRETKEKL